MTGQWTPTPIAFGQITLPRELDNLVEQLAENVHNSWALERSQNGWTYGPERCDQRKQTPLLIPYSQLREEEKNYDRRTVRDTLLCLIAWGYEIRCVRKSPEALP